MEYKGVIPKRILLKITSRTRPQELVKTVKSFLEQAYQPTYLTWLFSFDIDDDLYNSVNFCNEISELINGDVHFVFDQSDNKIHAINRDLEEFSREHKWDILICVSDDQRPVVAGYDDIIRNAMPNHLDSSLWFYDGAQPRINTMEIIGFNYWNRTKHIYNPLYKSFYCDNEATDIARISGKLIKSDECIIKHFHPAILKDIHYDDLYKRNDKYWDEDKATYTKRKEINFGIQAEHIDTSA